MRSVWDCNLTNTVQFKFMLGSLFFYRKSKRRSLTAMIFITEVPAVALILNFYRH